ncbi:tetratricopeptide repeat protein [Pseudoroseomonas wenyumeiae]
MPARGPAPAASISGSPQQPGRRAAGPGRPGGAANAFRAALEQRSGFHLARANLAQLLLQQGQAAAAEAQYRLLLRATPQDAAILAGLGESLRRQGRHAEAEAHLREALRLRPESGAAWVELGNILLAAARTVEAALCFHAALERDPRQPEAHLGLGIAAAAQGTTRRPRSISGPRWR